MIQHKRVYYSYMNTLYETPGLVQCLLQGGIVIMPSDTIYGVFCNANLPQSIQRLRKIKNRGNDKGFIVLAGSINDVRNFGDPGDETKNVFERYWPGPVSMIYNPGIKYPDIQFNVDEIACRVPKNTEIRLLLEKTGPLCAPSANPNGLPPAKNIHEARAYFGDNVDMYIDGGTIENTKPSKLIRIHPDGTEEILRE